jgi:hypothetical protein
VWKIPVYQSSRSMVFFWSGMNAQKMSEQAKARSYRFEQAHVSPSHFYPRRANE